MEILNKFIFWSTLLLFSIVSLVPFFAMSHIKIMGLPIHYLIVGGSVSILAILTLYNHRGKLTLFDKWLLVLMLGFSLSMIVSVDKVNTMKSIVSFFLRGIGVAFIVNKFVISDRRNNQVVMGLLSVASVVCLIGLVEFFTGRIPFFHKFYLGIRGYPIGFNIRSGMMSTIGHPLSLSAYLVLLVPMAVWFLQKDQREKSFFKLIPLLLILMTILLSFSRSSWIITCCILFVCFFDKRTRHTILTQWKLILISVTVVIMLIYFLPRLRNAFIDRFNFQRVKVEILDSHRSASYKTTWNILKEYPLFGVGMGNFTEIYEYYKAKGSNWSISSPDNMYLRFICETGIAGTLTFFCFIFYWLYQLWKKRNDDFIWAIFVGLIGFLVNQMAGDFFYWLAPQFLFWFMLGLGVASLNEVKGKNG